MKNLNLLFIPILFILTGCLGGVTVQKKDGDVNKTSNSNELERVVHVDYGSQTGSEYNDELSGSMAGTYDYNSTYNYEDSSPSQDVNNNSSSSITSTTEESSGSVIEESSSSVIEESSGSENQVEVCGIIYKKFNSDRYYLKNSNKTFPLYLSSNLEYVLDSNLNFPMDSGSICLTGRMDITNGNKVFGTHYGQYTTTIPRFKIFVESFTSTLITTNEHPDREEFRNDYSQEFCGDVSLQANNHTSENLYKIETYDGKTYNIKFSTKLGKNSDDAESFIYTWDDVHAEEISISTGKYCLYTNSAPAMEELWTSRRFLRVKYINGPWN